MVAWGMNENKNESNTTDNLLELIGEKNYEIHTTQKEVLATLKQINWAIRVGFLFIMLVISGIIKPGIFG